MNRTREINLEKEPCVTKKKAIEILMDDLRVSRVIFNDPNRFTLYVDSPVLIQGCRNHNHYKKIILFIDRQDVTIWRELNIKDKFLLKKQLTIEQLNASISGNFLELFFRCYNEYGDIIWKGTIFDTSKKRYKRTDIIICLNSDGDIYYDAI